MGTWEFTFPETESTKKVAWAKTHWRHLPIFDYPKLDTGNIDREEVCMT